VYTPDMKNYVRIVEKPVTWDTLYSGMPEDTRAAMRKAMRCRFCEEPSCARAGRRTPRDPAARRGRELLGSRKTMARDEIGRRQAAGV
jgi:prolycopene isomerase